MTNTKKAIWAFDPYVRSAKKMKVAAHNLKVFAKAANAYFAQSSK